MKYKNIGTLKFYFSHSVFHCKDEYTLDPTDTIRVRTTNPFTSFILDPEGIRDSALSQQEKKHQ